MKYPLQERLTPGARAEAGGEDRWRLVIPSGPVGDYRCAQMDDYGGLARSRFPHQAPCTLELRGRVSAAGLPGTWGFGLWNDPFGMGLGKGGGGLRLPALPNAAWFFYASPANHLALRDTHPADGFLAATFRAPTIPPVLLGMGAPGALFLAWPAAARLLRRLAARILGEDAVRLDADVTGWHHYRLEWQEQAAQFWVDDSLVFETPVSPRGRLGIVIWIDNQYAAFPADGRLRNGTQASPQEAWLEYQIISGGRGLGEDR